MDSNDESSSKLIEEIMLTSEDEEEIIVYSETTNQSRETVRSSPSKRESQKFQFTYEDISSNTNDSDINPASESNFIIPHSDSDTNTFELIQDEDESSKKSDNSSNNDVTQIFSMNIIQASTSFKIDENNNINESLISTSTPCSENSRILSRFNDFKLSRPCSVILQRVTESVIQSFKPKTKRKYEIAYKKQSDEESVYSDASNWSAGRKKKHRKQNYSFNSLDASISTSSANSIQNKNKNHDKKPKRGRKKKDSFILSNDPKMNEFLSEETNSGFDSSNYVCQISNNESIKLKICKTQKEILCQNEEASNHTIVLVSSRSNSPTRSEQVNSKIVIYPNPEIEPVAKNEANTVVKKNEDLLKKTLKKQNTKANTQKKNKNISKPKLDILKKPKENESIKKSIIEKITDITIDRSYKIPKLNKKDDVCIDFKSDAPKLKVTNGKSKKKSKKKNFQQKETQGKQVINNFSRENNLDYTKKNNKNRKTLELMSRDQIPKLKDFQKKRFDFNQAIGAKYPYFSILFMIDEYVKRTSTVACLDFDLLINNSPVDDSDLSITNLNRDEQIQLCRLMSRSAGRVNPFELVNMDPLLREYTDNYDYSLPDQLDSDKEDENFLNSINELTISEAYILYKRFITRLNSPYRTVELVRIANTDEHTLFVTFENDFEIDTLDLSIESVVNSSLHKYE